MDRAKTQQQSARISVDTGSAKTRLSGSRLIVARAVWLVLVVPSLGLFVVGLPAYYHQIQQPCVATTCNIAGELTVKGLRTLPSLGVSVSGYAVFLTIFWVIIIVVWSGIGFLLFWRRSDEWVALLAAFALVMFNLTYPGLSTTVLSFFYPALDFPITLIGLLGQVSFTLFFLLFPNGRLIPRWTGLIIPLLIVQAISIVVPPSLPFSQNSWPGWINGLLSLIIYGTIIVSQIYRYRRASTLLERQQTKWVAFAIGTVATGFIVFGLLFNVFFQIVTQPDSPYVLFQFVYPLLLLVLPISIGIAILRYRLYDIDVLINRTLVYSTLTATLALLYFGLIFALQSLFQGVFHQNNAVAIVISTLVIAALFQPLRHRLQKIVDRRFYRSKYDAAQIVETFSATLRNEVDLNQLREHLITVVQDTMQPAHVSLWLREPNSKLPPPDRIPPR